MLRKIKNKQRFHFFLLGFSNLIFGALIWEYWELKFGIGDAIAQFYPVAVLSLEHIQNLEFPLFNFYQHLGIPILGYAYYPVLNPFFPFCFFLSQFFWGDIQQTWDLFCFLHICIASFGFYFLVSYITGRSSIFAVMGGISYAYAGSLIYLGQEWFYAIAVFSYLPFVILFFLKFLKKPLLRFAILSALSTFLLLTSSNINFVFYSFHLVFIFFIRSLFLERRFHFPSIFHSFGFFLIMLGFLSAYLYLNYYTMLDSIRETGRVPIDKYFWTYIKKEFLFSNALFLPLKSGFSWETTRVLHFIGSLTVLFLLTVPYVLIKKRKHQALALLLIFSSAVFMLLSFGPEGYLGEILYNIPPYYLFRHSLKWFPFFQISIILLSFISAEIFFRKYERYSFMKYLTSLFFLIQILTYSFLIMSYDTSNAKRLTDVSFPVRFESEGLDIRYRTVGLWHNGDLYRTRYAEALLGLNFGSLYKVPAAAGYEPMMPKENYEKVGGNFHPGYYIDAYSFPLEKLLPFSLRFILVPDYQSGAVLDILKKRFPSVLISKGQLRENNGLSVRVLEILKAEPLVGSDSRKLNFEIRGNGVYADIPHSDRDETIVFAWLDRADLHIFFNGREMQKDPDSSGRIKIRLSGEHNGKIVLKYSPIQVTNIFWSSLFLLFFGMLFGWGRLFWRDGH